MFMKAFQQFKRREGHRARACGSGFPETGDGGGAEGRGGLVDHRGTAEEGAVAQSQNSVLLGRALWSREVTEGAYHAVRAQDQRAVAPGGALDRLTVRTAHLLDLAVQNSEGNVEVAVDVGSAHVDRDDGVRAVLVGQGGGEQRLDRNVEDAGGFEQGSEVFSGLTTPEEVGPVLVVVLRDPDPVDVTTRQLPDPVSQGVPCLVGILAEVDLLPAPPELR